MTQIEPLGLAIPFAERSTPNQSSALHDVLCRHELDRNMRRTSSAGDIPRTWKGNLGAASHDILNMRRGSAASTGTTGTSRTGTSSLYSTKDSDPTEVASHLAMKHSALMNGVFPSATIKPSSPATAEYEETSTPSPSNRSPATSPPTPKASYTPGKKPLRSVLRRPSSPTAYSNPINSTCPPDGAFIPGLHTSVIDHNYSFPAAPRSVPNLRNTGGTPPAPAESSSSRETAIGSSKQKLRKASAPETRERDLVAVDDRMKGRPRSAGARRSIDEEIDVEPRVSFSVEAGLSTSSGADSNVSEGHLRAFSAFMGQTRKHSGGDAAPEQMTAEEVRGMRIFLEQCHKRRGYKGGNTNSIGSDDDIQHRQYSSPPTKPSSKEKPRESERTDHGEGPSLPKRKRAKSSSATYTTTKQTHISNMSIFKPPSGSGSPNDAFAVTVVAEHLNSSARSNAEDGERSTRAISNASHDSEDMDEPQIITPPRKSSSSIKYRKLYLNTAMLDPEVVDSAATVAELQSTWRPGRGRSPSNSHTSNGSSGSRRPSDASAKNVRSPWLKSVRLPPRWLSLRNAMAFTNVLIITVAIVIISAVSFVLSKDTAQKALDTLGTVTLKSMALAVAGVFGRAEEKNVDTATAVSLWGMRPDSLVCTAFFWASIRGQSRWSGDQFYLVDTKGAFCGVLVSSVEDFETFTMIGLDDNAPTPFILRQANGTAPAPRYSYQIGTDANKYCPNLVTTACVEKALDTVNRTADLYDPTQRPFYRMAMESDQPSWTGVYNLGSGDGYGITNVLPVRQRNVPSGGGQLPADPDTLLNIVAVDMHLESISAYLSQWLSALLRSFDPQHSDLLYDGSDYTQQTLQYLIAEINTESILASSCPGLTGTTPDDPPALFSSLTGNPCLGNVAHTVGLLSALPTSNVLDEQGLSILSTPIRLWSESTLTIAARFTPRSGIQWAIVIVIPGVYFNIKLGQMYTLTIPLTAALVLVAAALSSFLITRAIGLPLKRAAEKMMRIADLNFDEDMVDQESSSDDDEPEEVRSGRRWSFPSLGRFSRSPSSVDNAAEEDPDSTTVARRSFFLPPTMGGSKNKRGKRRGSVASNKSPNSRQFMLKEIQLLNTAMDAMTSGLKSFSKYVPLDVVALLVKMKREAVLGVDEMSLSIFFSDIANFTTIAESMSPQQLVLVMSEYLSEMSSIILESQGIVDKFIGDAVMAFWNAPLYLEEHAIVACDAALKSQERLSEMRADWLEKGYPEIRARIGLNTGPALVGNLGSPTRLNYTCLGDTVNLASRLEELNKRYHTSIIVSDAVRDQVHEYFVLRPLDYVAVKGKTVAKKCFELVDSIEGCDPAVSRRMVLYEKAFDYYCQGEFEQAKHLFESYLVDVPWDVPATMHLEQCMRLEEEGVPSNWSPVVVLDEK
ncbi:uncharacterized protein EV422DRAFT_514580 [Fimicolochytrium jonesii]|uniref:uncharacterized protein n=1 Tax=Fimicolochytrium jonesii TaxID=1396493 RepID=UPI0022FF1CBF|nr:uncharacterized protein EV422DRAFT_514580 [Fimicolochytrium jonesii]KAI8825884.1 hypothetical protein EV422DRAFT_514580 [Fimicolochytrium jonesii]